MPLASAALKHCDCHILARSASLESILYFSTEAHFIYRVHPNSTERLIYTVPAMPPMSTDNWSFTRKFEASYAKAIPAETIVLVSQDPKFCQYVTLLYNTHVYGTVANICYSGVKT